MAYQDIGSLKSKFDKFARTCNLCRDPFCLLNVLKSKKVALSIISNKTILLLVEVDVV